MLQQCGVAGQWIKENHTPAETQAIAPCIFDFVRAHSVFTPTYNEAMSKSIVTDPAFRWLAEINSMGQQGFFGSSVVVNGVVAFINAMRALKEEGKMDEVAEAFMGAYKPVVFLIEMGIHLCEGEGFGNS